MIEPLVRQNPLVEYVGEIGEREKAAFLGNALALLFPIDWPEPFGLVMIEAMACGTPVIAFPCGSVPEVIDHGRTGFLVDEHRGGRGGGRAGRRARPRGGAGDIRAAVFGAAAWPSDYLEVYKRLSVRRPPLAPDNARRAILPLSA